MKGALLMARTSKTIYAYTCDLCGAETAREGLSRVYDGIWGRSAVDVCRECESKPIADVLAKFREKENPYEEQQPAGLRNLSGGERPAEPSAGPVRQEAPQ
jgi:hypothetical protein